MKRISSIFIIVGILAVIIIQLAKNKTQAENRVFIYDKETVIPVFGEVVSDKGNAINKSYSGVFEAINEVKISADIQGKITKIFVEEGVKIKKGQALVKIDDAMLQLQLNVLETKLDGLLKDEKRYENLTRQDAIPGITLEKTQNAIATLKAEKKSILEQINKTTVVAPFDGVITMKFCEIGGFASPAIPLFEIINQSDLKFVINVPEEALSLFSDKQDYAIRTNNSETSSIAAKLSQVSVKGGIGNSFKVEFSVEKQEAIKAKMIGDLFFSSEFSNSNVVTISSKAIIGSESRPEIYRVENGRAVRTPISIGSRNGDVISVTQKIKVGDTIITGGFINLFDNANVTVKL
jgi:RND family efflux transporter MFP subunit